MKDDDDLTSAYLLGAYDASREWREAAEFEARVAEWLTYDEVEDYTRDPCSNGCQFAYDDLEDCPHEREWCRLKAARIAVEAEMEHGKA